MDDLCRVLVRGAPDHDRTLASWSRAVSRASLAPVAAFILAVCFLTLSVSSATAANGTCSFSEGWNCTYIGNSWPKNTKLWFEAEGGANQRNWIVNYGYDGHGGTVEKCSGFLSFDGGELPQGCSVANPSYLSIPSWRRPGWVYIVHHASGPRNISGWALH
jgi:hypothetical protein